MPGDAADPDVAWDEAQDEYLIVWERTWSAFDHDVYAHRIDVDGNPIGGLILIEPDLPTIGLKPSVGGVPGRQRYLVAWQETQDSVFLDYDVVARSVDAGSGVLSARAVVADTAEREVDPVVGGNALPAAVNPVVVWAAESGIRGRRVSLPTDLSAPLTAPVVAISAFAGDGSPAITRSSGFPQQFLIAYTGQYLSGERGLFASLWDWQLAPLVAEVPVDEDVAAAESQPAVAGLPDGSGYYVTWRSATGATGDIFGRRYRYESASLFEEPVDVLAAVPGRDERAPAIAYSEPKYLVVWSEQGDAILDAELRILELEAATGEVCRAAEPIPGSSSGGHAGEVELAARQSGTTDSVDGLLAVWHHASIAPTFFSTIRSVTLAAIGPGGPVDDLEGGCGDAGTLSVANAAALGNPDFELLLTGADPDATVGILALNPLENLLPCGSCTWLVWAPSPSLRFTAPIVSGQASTSFPLPCDPALFGQPLHAQWTVVGGSASPCSLAPNTGLSNRLRIELGY